MSGLSLSGTGLSLTTVFASNIAGGVANQVVYQTAPSTTGFITAPSVVNSFLRWTGAAFDWSTTATNLVVGTTAISSGVTTQLLYDNGGVLGETAGLTWAAPALSVAAATTTAPGLDARIAGDTTARIAIGLNTSDVPRVSFGPGNAVRDTFIMRTAAATLQFGNADAAAPVAQTFQVQNVVAGTSNIAGATWTFKGSQGTGTGAGGSIIFQTAAAGSTGSTQNALATILTLNSNLTSTFSGNVSLSAGKFVTVGQPTNFPAGANVAPFAQFGAYDGASAPLWNARGIQLDFPAQVYTDTTATGVNNSVYFANWGSPSVAATNAGVTYTIAATLKLNAPVASTNVTFGHAYTINSTNDTLLQGYNSLGLNTPLARAYINGDLTDAAWTTVGRLLAVADTTLSDNTTTVGTTVTTRGASSLGIPTFAYTLAASTITNAATLYMSGPPVAGTNTTITWPWTIEAVGKSRFGVSNSISSSFLGAMNTLSSFVQSSGGTGTAVPDGITIHDVTTGSAWDLTRPFAVLDFSSQDGTGVSAGARGRIGTVMEIIDGGSSKLSFYTAPVSAGTMVERLSLSSLGNVVIGTAAVATTATDGFFYIPTSAGPPTGVPTAYAGRVPLVYDTTNHQFWIYDGGGWKQPKTPAAAATITWQ